MTLTPEDIGHWQSWAGKSETATERLEVESLRRFAAAIGEPLEVETRQPALAHWAFFLPVAGHDQIGPDGHPTRGHFLPPISLPRRMFAASDMRFHSALVLGEEAVRSSRILSVTYKAGRSGDLVLVDVEHEITQGGGIRVSEHQTIVYRGAGERAHAAVPAEAPAHAADLLWDPGPVDLFRFSAATFNSHRIHYDLPYATGEEAYPGLVVHAPYTAARLFIHARDGRSRPFQRGPRRFAFRAIAPLFAGHPIRLTAHDKNGEVAAVRYDGATAMIAKAEY